MGIRFVTPESIRLPLSDGDYIIIKRRLTHGERDDMMGRMLPPMTFGEKVQLDAKAVRTVKVFTYLLGWSSPVPMSPELPEDERLDTINSLDPDTFDEIERAIDAHLEREEASSKNVPAGVPAFAATLASAER